MSHAKQKTAGKGVVYHTPCTTAAYVVGTNHSTLLPTKAPAFFTGDTCLENQSSEYFPCLLTRAACWLD